jgi:hypothetical protein
MDAMLRPLAIPIGFKAAFIKRSEFRKEAATDGTRNKHG